MHTLPQTESTGDYVIDRDLPVTNDDDELRASIVNGVIAYQVFDGFDLLPERTQKAFIEALRVDNATNDATIVRVMRAAFGRVVAEELDAHCDRVREEVALFSKMEH